MKFLSKEEAITCYRAAATSDMYGNPETWQEILDSDDEAVGILEKYDNLSEEEQEKFERDLQRVVANCKEDFSSLPKSTRACLKTEKHVLF